MFEHRYDRPFDYQGKMVIEAPPPWWWKWILFAIFLISLAYFHKEIYEILDPFVRSIDSYISNIIFCLLRGAL